MREFRIPMPLSVEEYRRGQLAMTALAELEATANGGGKEGVEIFRNEPFDNLDGHLGVCPITGTTIPRAKGIYTLKRYHFASKVPAVVKYLAPANALFLVECAWNCFPRCLTVLVNGFLSPETLKITVETTHVDGDCELDNALGISREELAQRVVVRLDIRDAAGDPASAAYKGAASDSRVFRSAKTGRGPRAEGWARTTRPMCCASKVVRAHCSLFSVGGTVENAIVNQQRDIFTMTHNKAFVTLDTWADLDDEGIRRLEDEAKAKVDEQLKDVIAKAAPAPTGSGAGGPR